ICTSTGTTSMPSKATVRTCETKMRPQLCPPKRSDKHKPRLHAIRLCYLRVLRRLSATRFYSIPEESGDVGPPKSLYLADAGRGCHVDLREKATNHINANQDLTALAQGWTNASADLTFTIRDLGR